MTEQPTPSAPDLELEAPAPVFNTDIPHATSARPISEVARRALLEAAERRAAEEAKARAEGPDQDLADEHGGPRGPEPTRFGDWEKKGLAIDF